MKRYVVGNWAPIRRNGDRFVYGRLRTEKQVRRANELIEARVKLSLASRIAPRPYMAPALKKNLKVAQACFANCIKGF